MPALERYMRRRAPVIERALLVNLPQSGLAGTARLNEAIRAAVLGGGRRMRPVLVMLGAEACGGQPRRALEAACAVEYLHASSLVFDDLPAMDDASLRRGAPALHVRCGEDVALLAAIALLNRAYEIFGRWPRLLREAARAVGCNGMVGGQAVDLEGACSPGRLEKTTALMRLTMMAGGIAAGGSERDVCLLSRYGQAVGEAYQLCDDLLDALATEACTGKTSAQDMRHHRRNAAAEWGAETALRRAEDLVRQAGEMLFGRWGSTRATELLAEAASRIVSPAAALVTYNDSDHSRSRIPPAGRLERIRLAEAAPAEQRTGTTG